MVLAYLLDGERFVYVQRSSTGKGMRPTNVNITSLVREIGERHLSGTEQWGGVDEEIVPEDRLIAILVLIAVTGCHDFFPGLVTVGFKSALSKMSEYFETFKNNDLRLGNLVQIQMTTESGATTGNLTVINFFSVSHNRHSRI